MFPFQYALSNDNRHSFSTFLHTSLCHFVTVLALYSNDRAYNVSQVIACR